MRAFLSKQRGQVVLMVAMSALVLIGVVGLAIDTGVAYTIREKLSSATDSASLAAARAVSQGDTQADQTANAKAAAARFFAANFPAGYLGATATMNDPSVAFNNGLVTIDISASAKMPISLMGVLNKTPLTPGVTSQTIRKELDMVLVMDTSGSLSSSAANVRSSAVTFLQKFNNTTDRVGLLHFSYGSVVDTPIRTSGRGFDRATMTTQINQYGFTGSTASSEGMWQARAQLNSIPAANRSNLRVVVFFSDGAPNSVASYFPFNTAADCKTAGTMTTSDDTTVNWPGGLYDPNKVSTLLPTKCSPVAVIPPATPNRISNQVSGMPLWYNAHNDASNPNDPTKQEFKLVTTSPRVVTADMSTETIAWQNVNRAARNMAEALASNLRDQNVFVFTLGLGTELTQGTGPDKEAGRDVLKCMANSTDAPSRCYNPAKPVGLYCPAATVDDLTPCFSKLASAILRISK
ncbi:TadE/TadG family protein [Rugamonas sp.]|uniref:TadE/TadG family type IV pilus assembly protein n=1 Tax=Rugamonas sp. TaxID=1926287 RepID=UPI0025ED5A6F|nr:TadE/TadG family protein [Rugamonas sp.]